MQPGYPFTMDIAHWALVAFVLAMTFLSGVLGGFLLGLTHLVRHGNGNQDSKSIWAHYGDEE